MSRFIVFFITAVLLSSCNYLPKFLKHEKPQLDTIINFKKVDVPPSFEKCNQFIDQEKRNCFRKTMQEKVSELLQNFSDTTSITIDEIIQIDLRIDKQGYTSIKSLKIPKVVEVEMPNLEGYLEKAIDDFPKLSPALKRGIPVETQYKLPVHIKTE